LTYTYKRTNDRALALIRAHARLSTNAGQKVAAMRAEGRSVETGKKASNAATTSDQSPGIEPWTAEEDDATPRVPVMAAQDLPRMQTNNKVFHAIGMGDLQIQVSNSATSTKVLLKDALHVPDLCLTVVSIRRIAKAGYTVQFAEDSCSIKKGESGPVIGRIPTGANGLRLFKVEHAFAAGIPAEPINIFTTYGSGSFSVEAICALTRASSITGFQVTDNFPPLSSNMPKPLASQYARNEQQHRHKPLEMRSTQTSGDRLRLSARADDTT